MRSSERIKSLLVPFVFFGLFDVYILVKGLPTLLLATRSNIQFLEVNVSDLREPSTIIIDNINGIAAMDFIYTDSSVFWTDIEQNVIRHASLNKSEDITDVISTELESPDGLATDWIGRKLYWTDSDKKRIEVSELDGRNRLVLHWYDLDMPRAIALDPLQGYMFWTDVGEAPKIERSGMDGSGRRILIYTKIYWPNGLTIDYVVSKIYWIDAKLRYIGSCNFDGKNRFNFKHGELRHPFALTLFEQTLFWTDWNTRSVYSLFDWSDDDTVIYKSYFDPMDIHVYSEDRQYKDSNGVPCDHHNGGCSHLCLLSPEVPYFKCACPTGVKLLQDNRTCADGAEEILLIVRRTDLRIVSLDTPDFTNRVIPVNDVKHAIAVDYDPVEGHIYWTDDGSETISRSQLNGTEQEVVIGSNVQQPDGLAVDWIGRNLYWTDAGYDTIQVSRLDGSFRTTLILTDLDEPRVIRVDPLSGLMFWTDWGKIPKIERGNMDGSNRVVLVNTSISWPNGLAIDHGERNIYWADAKKDKLEAVNFEGRNRRVIKRKFSPHMFGLTLLGDYLYWSDWQTRSITRVDKQANHRKTINDQLPDLMGIKAVNVRTVTGTNDCAEDNFGCSHLCLVRERTSPRCVCSNGFEIDNDGKTCSRVPDARLILAYRNEFLKMQLGMGTRPFIRMPMREILNVLAFDIDVNDNRIYWIDSDSKTIKSAFINGIGLKNVVKSGLEYPEDLAIDWMSGNLYWTDLGTRRIEVARGDGSNRKVLLWKNIGYVSTLSVDPNTGYMFWMDWTTPYSLERAALDGTGRKTLLQNLRRTYGLTIDFSEGRLYWSNLERRCIESADIEGNNRTCVIGKDVLQPTRLALYENTLIWVDWQKQTIEQANKNTGSNRTVLQSGVGLVMDIVAHHPKLQTGHNACQENNGGCSHLCLPLPADHPSNTTHSCACPTHFILNKDTISCSAPTSFLLFSQRNTISQLVIPSNDTQNEVLGTLNILLPIDGLKNIKALSYDRVDNFIYAIDGKTWTIKRFNTSDEQATTVLENDNMQYQPYDLDIEPFSRLLFWTCSKTNVIRIARLNLTTVGVVVQGDDEKPRSIALDPLNGLMYWINMAVPPTIEEASLDGSKRITLISEDFLRPGSLTIDIVEETLFWTDLRLQRIESYDLSYGTRRILVDGHLGNPKGISVLGDFLYWVDKKHMVLERINKVSAKNRTYIKLFINGLSDVLAAQNMASLDTPDHPCSNNNGGCSHICIPSSDGNARCSCPLKHRLRNSYSKDCIAYDCSPTQFECRSGRITCIPSVWRCDGSPECEDRSDEADCPIIK